MRVHLPLFNAAEDEDSLCCCFASTNTDVGKLLTSTVVDNKTAKMAKTWYLKNRAIFCQSLKWNVNEIFSSTFLRFLMSLEGLMLLQEPVECYPWAGNSWLKLFLPLSLTLVILNKRWFSRINCCPAILIASMCYLLRITFDWTNEHATLCFYFLDDLRIIESKLLDNCKKHAR